MVNLPVNKYYLAYRVLPHKVRLITEDGLIVQCSGLTGCVDPLVKFTYLTSSSIVASIISGYFLIKLNANPEEGFEYFKEINSDVFPRPFRELAAKSTTIANDKNSNKGLSSLSAFEERFDFTTVDDFVDFNGITDPISLSILSYVEVGDDFEPINHERDSRLDATSNNWWHECISYTKHNWTYDEDKTPRVAIIDKGISIKHSTFYASWGLKLGKGIEQIKALINSSNLCCKLVEDFVSHTISPCESGHGSRMAGVICGKVNNFTISNNKVDFVSFAPGLPINAIRGFKDQFKPKEFQEALAYAVNLDAEVINVSHQLVWSDHPWKTFLELNPTITVVTASGNGSSDLDLATNHLGFDIAENLVPVTALYDCSSLRKDANKGSHVSFAVPGRRVMTSAAGVDEIQPLGGQTSIAAAIMTGAITRVIESNPSLRGNPAAIVDFLKIKTNDSYDYMSEDMPVSIPIPNLSFL